jgi:GpV Apex motif
MADNAQKTPFGLSMNRWASGKVQDGIAVLGRQLPCVVTAVNGSIVTVAFQVTAVSGQDTVTLPPVTMPVVGTEYVRCPIQVGCRGVAIAADVYLGGVSGIGGGTATTATPGNLTALAFVPLGNTGFTSVDGHTLTLYGEPGVLIKDKTGAATLSITSTGITMSFMGKVVTLNGSGLTIDGILFDTHVHGGVQTGSGDTGGPV